MEDKTNIVVEYISPKHWYSRAKWRLVEEYESYTGIIVPVGFITDGVSVPRPFTIFFSPTGEAFKASIVHDYIIVTQDNWDLANILMREELERSGLTSFRKNVLYYTVKLWARFKKRGAEIQIQL